MNPLTKITNNRQKLTITLPSMWAQASLGQTINRKNEANVSL